MTLHQKPCCRGKPGSPQRKPGGQGSRENRRAEPTAKRAVHPDQQATAERIADTLEELFGREVDVVPARASGFRVQLAVDSHEDALELVRRLRIRPAA